MLSAVVLMSFVGLSFAENYTKVPLWGGDIQVAAVAPSDPQVVYVCSAYNGTYVTRDGGETWTSVKFAESPGFGPESIAVHPTQPNIALADSFRTDDYGATWKNASINISIERVVASKNTPGTFYIAGTETGPNAVFYKSTDSGLTWGSKTAVAAGNYATSIDVDSNGNLYVTAQNAADVYQTDYSGFLYKSTDDGASWTLIKSFNFWPDNVQVASNTVLVNGNTNSGATDHFCEISNDSGATFISTTICTAYRSGRHLSPDGAKMYFYTGSSRSLAISSAPAWDNYTILYASMPISYTQMGAKPGVVVPVASDPSLFYLTNSEQGILKSTDACASWQPANNGIGGVIALSGCKDPAGDMYMIGNITLYKGTNNGQSWRKIYCPDEVFGLSPRVGGVVVSPSTGVVLYAARGELFRSADGGDTWPANPVFFCPFSDVVITKLVFNKDNPSICYLSYSSGSVNTASSGQFLHKSVDYGATWSQMPFTGNSVHALAIDPSNPAILYAGIGDQHGYGNSGVETFGGMWKIIDNGVNTPVKTQVTGLDNYLPYKIAVDTNGIVFAMCKSNGGNDSLMYSSDGGSTWQQSEMQANDVQDIAFSQGIYYVATPQGIYASVSLGTEFTKVTDSNDIGTIRCLVLGSMYGGADSGLYKLAWAPETLTEVLEKPKVIGGPNPFNPKNGNMVIKYSVPHGQTARSIKINIYNIAGESVYDSSNNSLAGGYIYSYSWDGKNSSDEAVASGVYIVVFNSSIGVAKTKVAVMR